ncbi:hypothetical protein CkaCkLH20_04404 [Colletotrichum karsti]|uniref:Uncharacterized protein n=1 Tax=Colletotrichum karsti TaxID=1095194 RepID=A0A9P6IAU2_9PEZI|nr:uncharacterized protein CkaCkLH20_04404 [Colletotrichum karsti]KAF9878366.1 hypothetical protein CkaCkLH20_04404 [Colletotrichum karsti]
MSSKRNSGDWAAPRRLPSVREKLSGFVRRGRGLAKKTTLSMLGERERPSLDESQKAFPRVQVQDFGTSCLDIDLQSLEAFRIAPEKKGQEAEDEKPPQSKSSTTPIADMFAKRTTTIEPVTVNPSLNKSSPSLLAASETKPTGVPSEKRRPGHAPSLAAPSSNSASIVTIVNSSHAQPHSSRPWPPPAAAPTGTQSTISSNQSKTQFREPRRAVFASSRPAPAATPESTARPRQNAAVVAEQNRAEKRHSTPTSLPSSNPATNKEPTEPVTSDRRRSWQPSPCPSLPPSASAPYRNGGIPSRRASSRLPADRLGWIKELEEGRKNRPTINSDLPVLKTMQGGVADKLARFESKQMQTQLAPMTRSNSTRSRTSSVADTTFSSYGMATARSSLDSHRTSSVFSHYDDSFREKMELIAGGPNREGTEEKPSLTKVTASFVSVERRAKQACVDKPQEV